jgi:co-chaperonin GroES (HSP10)
VFKPVNRHILIDLGRINTPDPETLIVLPDDYAPEQAKFIKARTIACAEDVRFKINTDDEVIVDRSMIEEITIGSTTYNVILDNYIMGILE